MGEMALKMNQVGKVSKDFALNFSQRSKYFLREIFLLGSYLTYEQVLVERVCEGSVVLMFSFKQIL